MSYKTLVQHGEVTFFVYEKSIRVESQYDSLLIFYGRDVDHEKDVQVLLHLIEIGSEIKAAAIRKVLA